jgi:hypothetical protein
MGAYSACGLLSCAAKRSGAIPPNMPAGLRARVSRLGGFMRPFFGFLLPPAGDRLFVITGDAVASRSRSSPILMGWWSVPRSDYRSPLVELANTTNSVKGSTNRKIFVQTRAAPPSIWGAFAHFLNYHARCGSAR